MRLLGLKRSLCFPGLHPPGTLVLFPERSRDLRSKSLGAETLKPTTPSEELASHFFHFGLRELAKR